MTPIRLWGIAGLLVFAVLAGHSGAPGGRFHYDDTFAIVENPSVRDWQPMVYFSDPRAISSWVDGSGYRPLTVASFALNYAVGRLDPRGYLTINLVLHLVATGMVFVIGRHLLNHVGWAAVAAVLFALHPVNAEAVNYVVARSSLLSTVGALIAFWAFLRHGRGGGWRWLILALAAFAAALLSKESAIALLGPLAASLLLFEPSHPGLAVRQGALRRALPVLPFAALALLYVTMWWRIAGGAIASEGAANHPGWAFLEMMGRSLLLWLWPWPLGLEHPVTFVDRFDAILAVLSVMAVLGYAAVIVACWRRASLVSWALIWIAAGLLPLLPLPWITTRGLLQENRLAFSAVGLAWLSAVVIRGGWNWLTRRGYGFGFARWMGIGIAAVLVLAAVGIDRWRSAVWHDDRSLWEEATRNAPTSPIAHVNRGAAYLESLEYDRAEAAFQRAVSLAPNHARAHYNLGLLAMRRNQYSEARASFARAISADPGYAKAYRALGTLEMEGGQPAAAVEAFRRAAALNPRDAQTYAQFGVLAQRSGDQKTAEAAYREALRHDPGNPEIRNHLGVLYLGQRRWTEALDHFSAAVRNDPRHLEAAYNRAVALYRLGRVDDAKVAIDALLPLIPAGSQFDSYRRAAQAIRHAGQFPDPSRSGRTIPDAEERR